MRPEPGRAGLLAPNGSCPILKLKFDLYEENLTTRNVRLQKGVGLLLLAEDDACDPVPLDTPTRAKLDVTC